MLSVTYSYAFSSYSFCSTGNARLFLLHSSLTSRQCSITSAVGVGRWNSAQFPIQEISILQRRGWSGGTPQQLQKGENTEILDSLQGSKCEREEEGRRKRWQMWICSPLAPALRGRCCCCCSPCLQGNSSGPWDCSLRHFHPPPLSLLSLRVIT